jgi:hypothetical protein
MEKGDMGSVHGKQDCVDQATLVVSTKRYGQR